MGQEYMEGCGWGQGSNWAVIPEEEKAKFITNHLQISKH